MNSERQPPRFYIPHHLIFYPVMSALFFTSLHFMSKEQENAKLWLFIAFTLFSVIALAFMLRQHYALGNQDRIIRLEMRYRYFATTGQRFEKVEHLLSFKQIAALRFASDDELSQLVVLTLTEKLSGAQIKDRIKNYVPDHMRL